MTVSRGIRNRDPETYAIRRFVDALREVLGLDPLYLDPRRTEGQRFAEAHARVWAGFDPNGNRTMPRAQRRTGR